MKRVFNMILSLLAVLVMASGCEEVSSPSMVEGEWHCAADEWDIYIDFASTGTFQLYQLLGQGRHYLYNGTWHLEDNILSGQYNDGTSWGSDYTVSFDSTDATPGSMTLTPTNGSNEVHTYERTTIPEEVRNGSVVEVRSGVVETRIPAPIL